MSENERKQLEEDIERIKSTLQHDSDVEILEDEDEDEDCLVVDETLDALPTSSTQWSTFTASNDNEWDVASEASTSAKPVVNKRSGDSPQKAHAKSPLPDAAVATENAALPQMCLALNKAYQEIIMENLESIQQMIIRNRHKQEELQAELSSELASRNTRNNKSQAKKMPLSYYGFPYFRDKAGLPQPINVERRARLENMEVDGYTRISKYYTNKEKKWLQRALEEDKLKQKLRPLLARKELELEKVQNAKNPEAVEEAETRLSSLEQQISKIRSTSEQIPFTEEEEKKIDWMKISIVDFDGERDPDDIRLYWKNALHPSINKGRWRMSEDMNLAKVVEENGGRDWAKIAEQLQTNRTPFQCLQRFQMKLNPCLQTGKWMEEEDVFLKEVVESLTVNGHTPWDQVAYYMEGRSDEQCEARWKTHDDLKMGKWSPDEDKILLTAVKRCGYKWASVQEFVPNRSAPQCRERYMNRFIDGHRSGVFSYVEDRILWQLVQDEGTHWSRIASCLPGRNDNACMQRYKILKLHEAIEKILGNPPFGPDVVSKLVKLRARNLVKPQVSARENKIKKKLEKSILMLTHRISVLEKYQAQLGGFRTESGKLYRDETRDKKIRELTKERENLQQELNNISTMDKQRECDIEDAEQMLSDRKAGIYVPVVLLGERVFARSCLEKNLNHPSDELIEKLDSRIKKIDLSTRRKANLYNDQTLYDLIVHPDFKRPPKHRKKGRISQAVTMSPQKCRAKEKESRVNKDICTVLSKTTPKTAKRGRPRNYYADAPENNTDSTAEVESKVVKLFAKALNMNAVGTKQQTEKVINEHGIDLGSSYSEDVESFRLKKNIRQLKNSLWNDLGEAQAQGSNTESTSQTIEQIFPRWALRGPEATKAYNLPPLPPSVCSLRGFGSLLLDRKNLVKQTKAKPKTLTASKRACPATSTPAAKHPRVDAVVEELKGDTFQSGDGKQVLDSTGVVVDRGTRSEVSQETCVGGTVNEVGQSRDGGDTYEAVITNGGEGSSQPCEGERESENPASKTPTVIVMKSMKLTKDAVTSALQSKGITADPGKLHMQVMSKSELQARMPGNSLQAGNPEKSKLTMSTIRATHDYELLKARFKSMFLWPALLSTIKVEPRQKSPETAESHESAIEIESDSQAGDDVKPLIVGAQGLAKKQSKKGKTSRNRYPCNYGSRARKISAMPRDKKLVRVQTFKSARLNSMQKSAKSVEPDTSGGGPLVDMTIQDIDLPTINIAEHVEVESVNETLKTESDAEQDNVKQESDMDRSVDSEGCQDSDSPNSLDPLTVSKEARKSVPLQSFVCDLRNVAAGRVFSRAMEGYEFEVASQSSDRSREICIAEAADLKSSSPNVTGGDETVMVSELRQIKTSPQASQPLPGLQMVTPQPVFSTKTESPKSVVPQMLFENSANTCTSTNTPSTPTLIHQFQTPQPARSSGVCKFFTPRQVQGPCRFLRPKQKSPVCKFFRPSKSPSPRPRGPPFQTPMGVLPSAPRASPAVVPGPGQGPMWQIGGKILRQAGSPSTMPNVTSGVVSNVSGTDHVDSKEVMYVILKDETSEHEMLVSPSSIQETSPAMNGQFATYTEVIESDPTSSNS